MEDRADWITDLFFAVRRGNTEVLKDALAQGFDPHVDLWHGDSIVTAAAEHSETTLARVFELIGTVDISDTAGLSPLQSAAMSGDLAAVRRLLRMGASVEWTNMAGDTILHIAAHEGVLCEEIFVLLLSYATVRALLMPNMAGYTPITQAERNETSQRFEQLCARYLELGGSLEVRVDFQEKPMRDFIAQAGLI